MNKDQKVSDIRFRFERRSEAVTHQNNNDVLVSNNHTQGLQDAYGSAEDNATKTGNLQRHNSVRDKRMEIEKQLNAIKLKNLKGNNDATKCSISQAEKTDIPNKTLSNNTNTTTSELVPCNNGVLVSNNYTQGLQDASGSTEDNATKAGNLQRKKSIYDRAIALEKQLNAIKLKDLKGNNDATKCGISQAEKTDMPNKTLSNNTNTTTSELVPVPPPPPPPPPSSYSTNSMMQGFNSTTAGNNNLSTSTFSTPQDKGKSNIHTNIKIDTKVDTPMQLRICAKAGISTIIEINAQVDTEIEINTNPSMLCIQSSNQCITLDNSYTNSSGSDSGRDTLSGSVSDVSCFGKIW